MLQNIVKNKPYLTWYVRDKNSLSDESILEHVLSFGNWDDVIEVEKTIGIKEMKSLFEKITDKKRVNLKPRTVNYFNNYFEKYA